MLPQVLLEIYTIFKKQNRTSKGLMSIKSPFFLVIARPIIL